MNINLWVGLALLVACGLFMAWGFSRPLVDEPEDDDPATAAEPEAPAAR